MNLLVTFWESLVAAFLPVLSGSNAPLFLAALFLLIVVAVGASYMWTARYRATTSVAELLDELATARAKLIEAEKTGRFGTFSWDFVNPATSFWSEEMFELFGLVARRKPPHPASLLDTVHEKDREKTKEAWEKAQNQPGDFVLSFRTVAPSGQVRYLELRGKTMFDVNHKPKLLQGVAHDVTKEMEIDRAKSEFVSLASHQLKTPLTSIKWLIEAMLAPGAEPLSAEQSKYLTNVYDATRRMVEMVNDLLNVSRIELERIAVHPEDVDVCDMVKSVAEEQRHAAETKHITVKLTCGSGIPSMKADKALLRMVIQNLLSNAIKYTLDGGSVECEASLSSGRREMIFLRVTDTGIGIPKGERENVFKKLYRATNAQNTVPDGTGLGLYVVKTVVEYVKGGISFESTEGKGTTFYVSLPVSWAATDGAKKTTV